MARRANRSQPVLNKNVPTCNHCPTRSFLASRKPGATSIATVTSKWRALITKFRPNLSATRSGSDGTAAVYESSTSRWNRSKSIAGLNQVALAVLGARGLHAPVISSCRYWISRAAVIGEQCGQWAQGAFERRGAESLRSIMGLCALIKQHSATAINTACSKALKAGTYRFKDLRRLIGSPSVQQVFGFAENHPLIRDLTIYSNFITQFYTHEQHP